MSQKSRRDAQASPSSDNRPAPARQPGGPRRRGLLFAAATLLVLGAGSAALLWRQQGSPFGAGGAGRPELASSHAPALGDAAAKVHIVEFLDPACETCAVFYPLVKQLMAEHPGRIRLSVRHVPFHKGSDAVVAMLEASRRQGRYWQVLEALLVAQGLWVDHHVVQPAMARQVVAAVGLDMAQLDADMRAAEVAERMARDRQDAAALGVEKTPEYFVNGRQMASFGRQQLQDLVRDAVRRAY